MEKYKKYPRMSKHCFLCLTLSKNGEHFRGSWFNETARENGEHFRGSWFNETARENGEHFRGSWFNETAREVSPCTRPETKNILRKL